MQLTCSCPNCGTDYELPWSMAGKAARCRRCSIEFVVPAPYEPRPPRSSEAIPVVPGEEASQPRPPSPSRKTRVEVPPPEPVARTLRIEGLTAAQIAKLREAAPESNIQAQPVEVRQDRPSEVRRSRPAVIREVEDDWSPSPRLAHAPSARPDWLIPSIVGGGIVLILAVNIGFYLSFYGVGKSSPVEQAGRVKPRPSDPAGTDPGPDNPVPEVGAPAQEPSTEATTPKPDAPPAEVARTEETSVKVAEEIPDGPMKSEEIVSRYEPSVALIKGKRGSGTGFIVRIGIIATNAHVIDSERIKDLEVRFPSAPEGRQGPYPARLIYNDKDRDLALLGVATDLPPVRVAEEYKLRKGEDVTVIGNPGVDVGSRMILKNAVSKGIVSSMTRINQHTFLQLGIAINPGNSGGPVFDHKGRVIGVITLKTVAQEALAFAIPAEDLLTALENAEPPSRPQ